MQLFLTLDSESSAVKWQDASSNAMAVRKEGLGRPPGCVVWAKHETKWGFLPITVSEVEGQ